MFVVIKNGGKQYKVQPGDIVKLEYLGQDKGKKISLKEVLACNIDSKDYIGAPYLNNVEVKIEILENKKDKKVLVFKKRRRHNSRRKNGHRQNLSVVQIEEISVNGKSFKSEKTKKVISTKKSADKPEVIKKEKTKSVVKETEKLKKDTKKKG